MSEKLLIERRSDVEYLCDRKYPVTLTRCRFFNILNAISLAHRVDIFSLCSILKIDTTISKANELNKKFFPFTFDFLENCRPEPCTNIHHQLDDNPLQFQWAWQNWCNLKVNGGKTYESNKFHNLWFRLRYPLSFQLNLMLSAHTHWKIVFWNVLNLKNE